MQRTTVLVTGANGFIGRALCRRLTEQGYVVRGSVRSADKLPQVIGEKVIVGEIGGATDWSAALAGVSAVIHLAGRAHVLNEAASHSYGEFEAVNVQGTERLAEAASCASVQRFVYVSSVGVHGERSLPDQPLTEQSPTLPTTSYGESKLAAERALENYRNILEIVIVRPPLVYGFGAPGNFGLLLRLINSGLPLPFGTARNLRSLIGVDNLADLLERCVSHRAAVGETFLASDNEDVSTPELIRRLARAFGKRSLIAPVPETLLRAGLRPIRREGVIDRLFGSLVVDSRHARQTLDWSPPVTMQAAFAKMAREHLQKR